MTPGSSRRYNQVTDPDMARLDDFAPDAEGDVVLAAELGQRVQDARVSCARLGVAGGDDAARHGREDAQRNVSDGHLLPAPAVLGPGISARDRDGHAEPARVRSRAAELRGERVQRCLRHQRHRTIVSTQLVCRPLEQVDGPAEVARERVAQRTGYDPSGYFPAVIHPGHRGGPGPGHILDDATVRETQRQQVPRRFPAGLDPQQAGVPGRREQLALIIDDEELTVAGDPVAIELDLGAALQPHALDRRDRQLRNGDRQTPSHLLPTTVTADGASPGAPAAMYVAWRSSEMRPRPGGLGLQLRAVSRCCTTTHACPGTRRTSAAALTRPSGTRGAPRAS